MLKLITILIVGLFLSSCSSNPRSTRIWNKYIEKNNKTTFNNSSTWDKFIAANNKTGTNFNYTESGAHLK